MSIPSTPAKLYESSLRTLSVAAGQPRRRYPLPPDCPIQFAAYAFDQDFEILASSFPPAPKNTPSNAAPGSVATFGGLADGNAILTRLSQPASTAGGKVKFAASFAIVPASWDDIRTQTVTFPGIRNVNYTGGVRDPKPWSVNVRVRCDYFVLDPASVLSGAGVVDSGGSAVKTAATKAAIPTILHTPFGFLVSGSMLTSGEVTGLVASGGITGWLETVPNTGTYQSWVSTAVAFNAALVSGGTQAWDATHPPLWNGTATGSPSISTVGQWCFQDSKLFEHEGCIIRRESYYVLAQ